MTATAWHSPPAEPPVGTSALTTSARDGQRPVASGGHLIFADPVRINLNWPPYNISPSSTAAQTAAAMTSALAVLDTTTTGRGGTIEMAPGTYNIQGPINWKSRAALTCAGVPMDGYGVKLLFAAGSEGIVLPNNVVNTRFENVNVAGGTIGMDGQGECVGLVLRNVTFSGSSGDGLRTDALENFLFDHVNFTGCGGIGWHGGVVNQSNGRTERGLVINPRFDSIAGDACKIEASTTNKNWTMISPAFITCQQNGLSLNGATAVTVIGLNCENAGTLTDNTYDAVVVAGGSSRCTFIACEPAISAATPFAHRYGFNIAGTDHVFTNCNAAGRTKGWNITGSAKLDECSGTATLPDWASSMRCPIIGGSIIIDTANQTSSKQKSTFAGAPGADLVFVLEDSSRNQAGTLGTLEVRRSDVGRVQILSLGPNAPLIPRNSITLKTKAGGLADGDFDAAPGDGTVGVDTTGGRFCVRTGGNWRYLYVENTPVTKTGAYTMVVNDGIVLADATTAGFTVTLPSASAANGKRCVVKKIDSSANVVTISPPSGTIDGAASVTLTAQWQKAIIVSNGTNWYVIG